MLYVVWLFDNNLIGVYPYRDSVEIKIEKVAKMSSNKKIIATFMFAGCVLYILMVLFIFNGELNPTTHVYTIGLTSELLFELHKVELPFTISRWWDIMIWPLIVLVSYGALPLITNTKRWSHAVTLLVFNLSMCTGYVFGIVPTLILLGPGILLFWAFCYGGEEFERVVMERVDRGS